MVTPSTTVGVAEVDISPSLGTSMAGYAGRYRTAEDIHDPLFGQTLIVGSEPELIIVSCDVIAISQSITNEIREQVKVHYDIPPENVMICCSHTHTGPQIIDLFHDADEEYQEYFIQQIVSCVEQALVNKADAELGRATSEVPSICHNRRVILNDGTVRLPTMVPVDANITMIEGPTDSTVSVLTVKGPKGDVRGVLVNYASHTDVITGSEISADYPGVLRETIKQVYGEDTVVLFVLGASGDLEAYDFRDPASKTRKHYYDPHGERKTEQVGRILAGEVIKAIESADPVQLTDLTTETVYLSVETRAPAEERVNEARAIVEGNTDLQRPSDIELSEEEYRYRSKKLAESLLEFVEYQSENPTTKIELQTFNFGGMIIASIPGELFAAFGLELRERLPSDEVFIAGYTNDYIGYIPTKEAFRHGGYETRAGWHSRLAEETGEEIVERLVEIGGQTDQ